MTGIEKSRDLGRYLSRVQPHSANRMPRRGMGLVILCPGDSKRAD